MEFGSRLGAIIMVEFGRTDITPGGIPITALASIMLEDIFMADIEVVIFMEDIGAVVFVAEAEVISVVGIDNAKNLCQSQ